MWVRSKTFPKFRELRCHYGPRDKGEHSITEYHPSFLAQQCCQVLLGVRHSPKPSPNMPEYPYMGHILSSFYAFAQAGALGWDAPIPLMCLTVIKIQLKCHSACDTIPDLARKN